MLEGTYNVLGKTYKVYWRAGKVDRKTTKQLIAEQIGGALPGYPLSEPFPIHEEQISRGLRQGTWKKVENK